MYTIWLNFIQIYFIYETADINQLTAIIRHSTKKPFMCSKSDKLGCAQLLQYFSHAYLANNKQFNHYSPFGLKGHRMSAGGLLQKNSFHIALHYYNMSKGTDSKIMSAHLTKSFDVPKGFL